MSLVENSSVVVKPSQLPDSLKFIIESLQITPHPAPSGMRALVLEAKVQEKDLIPWADFGHSEADSYGRKLVYEGDQFEIMVMSWSPGDFSGIHDHGFTQWGAVQVFGPMEHAIFRMDEEQLSTLARMQMKTGEVVGVSHSLIHQMGNPSKDESYLSLHVYGTREEVPCVTGSARLFDPQQGIIQRINGGVFFALPEAEIESVETGARGDLPTRIRYQVELQRRLRKMESLHPGNYQEQIRNSWDELFSSNLRREVIAYVEELLNDQVQQIDSRAWRILNRELQVAAALQLEFGDQEDDKDHFQRYASLYDEVVGKPCLKNFMAGYWRFFKEKSGLSFAQTRLLSLGCGTGLVEEYLVRELGMQAPNILGIDLSSAMVEVASSRIPVQQGSLLDFDFGGQQAKVVYSGLNVFHYLPANRLEDAIRIASNLVEEDGWFLGDFITPDHTRWYPSVLFSADKRVISLRTPRIIELDGGLFQESEITNLDFRGDYLQLDYAGKHLRHLPSLYRVRLIFETYFPKGVRLYDAVSLEPIEAASDTCTSTRYLVLAKK